MSERIRRYEDNVTIVQHLASQYVCGLLPARVRRRVETLITRYPYGSLNRAIQGWELQLSSLDENTADLALPPDSWNAIETQLEPDAPVAEAGWKLRVKDWLLAPALFVNRAILSAAVVLMVALGSFIYSPTAPSLSYIAVLSQDEKPQLIAATYGESRELRLDIIDLPKKSDNEDFELWVVSKTDKHARSLGIIDARQKSQMRHLTVAQWRLIKDSHSLLITREETGGSPIGEPFGEVVSQGLCIQMPDWKSEVL